MVTFIIIAVLGAVAWFGFKSYAKKLPAKRISQEIIELEAEIGDVTVSQMRRDFDEAAINAKQKRLKTLWAIRENSS